MVNGREVIGLRLLKIERLLIAEYSSIDGIEMFWNSCYMLIILSMMIKPQTQGKYFVKKFTLQPEKSSYYL